MLLPVILGVALFFRFSNLGFLPQGFHNDEVMNGYVGRFTLHNGVDLYGNPWPLLHFDNFGDYPNILPMYVSGLFSYIFGVNEFAVRFPIALAGVISVGIIYLITKQLTTSLLTPFLVAFGLAVLPWHIVLSRATSEGVLAGSVFLAGYYALLRAIKTQRIGWLIVMTSCFGLTYFLYPSFRIMVPLSLFPLVLLFKQRKYRLLSLVITFIFIMLTGFISQTNWGKGRYEQTSVFTYNNILTTQLTQLIFDDGQTPETLTHLFHNKVWVGSREVIKQYLGYWSGVFLVVKGGLPARYQLTDQGLLYLAWLGFGVLAVGLHYFQNSKGRNVLTVNKSLLIYYLYLLLMSPLPAALTAEDAPNVHRSLLMGVLLVIGVAGIIQYSWARSFRGKRLILAGLLSFMIFEIAYFWHQYSVHSATSQALSRNHETTLLAHYLIDHAREYTAVAAPAESRLAIRYLFYSQRFDKELAGQFGKDMHIEQLDNIRFAFEGCNSIRDEVKRVGGVYLLIDTHICPKREGINMVSEIKRDDGTLAYRLYQIE